METGLQTLTRRLSGLGLGGLPGVARAYRLLQATTPSEKTEIDYNGGTVTIVPARSPLERELYWRGEYEPNVRNVIHRELSEGDTAIDVGAHVGHHTVSMREAVGSSGGVIAIEPDAERRETLRETVKCYENVHVLSCAVSDSRGTGYLSGDIPKLSDEGQEVTVTTLDTILNVFELESVRLVKIDVEGHEEQVLSGLDRYRDRVGCLIVEVHRSDWTHHCFKRLSQQPPARKPYDDDL